METWKHIASIYSRACKIYISSLKGSTYLACWAIFFCEHRPYLRLTQVYTSYEWWMLYWAAEKAMRWKWKEPWVGGYVVLYIPCHHPHLLRSTSDIPAWIISRMVWDAIMISKCGSAPSVNGYIDGAHPVSKPHHWIGIIIHIVFVQCVFMIVCHWDRCYY